MSSVLQISIPWMRLQPWLAEADADGKINYTKFLERYKVHVVGYVQVVVYLYMYIYLDLLSFHLTFPFLTYRELAHLWQDRVIERICSRIYESSGDLRKEFQKYDKDGNGKIDYDEFIEAMKKQKLGLSNDQLYDLMRTLDTDSDNSIDIEEFVERFQVR